MVRRSISALSAAFLSLIAVLGFALPAHAVTPEQKLAAMSAFSQPNATSFNAWHAAWQNQAAWADYNFDWSTDLCSSSPDQPLGFDFRMPCRRHDFGYRNYKAMNAFPANKARIDDAFYFDMREVCARYSGLPKSTCNGLAWTYYQAVKNLGSLQVTDEQIQQVKLEAELNYQNEAA
ncbi:phospholipase [Nonomuraea typhae]|uniref:phospholipase n=1 Tax=Nonomuraea typhae TaxID=2603600 RepID=UPI0012F9E119|nr:phospholipase [Nonomuraea typhae]